jgi:hypothetical protein
MRDSYIRKANILLRLIRPLDLKFTKVSCPLCKGKFLIRLQNTEHGIRCLSCTGGPTQMSLAYVIQNKVPELSKKEVYELSSRGALYKFFCRETGKLTCSEYFDEVPPGSWVDDVQCQNVEKLTYESESFDLCTSSDVFEHE